MEDNKACRKPGCPCCAHWNATLYRLLTLLGTVLDALEMTAAARNRLLQEIADLRRRLLLFDNPNTPPFQKPISRKKRSNQNNPDDATAKKLPDAQPGHKKTEERLPVDVEEHHECIECPGYHGKDLTEYDEEEDVITDIPRIVRAVTIRHRIHVYRCNGCGHNGIRSRNVRRAEDVRRVAAAQAGLGRKAGKEAAAQERQDVVHIPRSGTYGLNILAAILFNFMDRLPHRLNVASMGRIGLRISVGTVHNILYRIGMGLEPSSREILERVRKAYVLHIDETSLFLNGKLVWIWIFFNPETGDVYYAIRRSRDGDILAEVLGGSWAGRIVCDGLSPYKKYRIQRCWAHIINEIKHIKDRNPDCPEAQIVLDRLREIHKIGPEATGSLQERRCVRNLLRKRVKRLIDTYGGNPETRSVIRNHAVPARGRPAAAPLRGSRLSSSGWSG